VAGTVAIGAYFASSAKPSQAPQGCKFWKFGNNQ